MLGNHEKPTRAAVYCRVSSEEQAGAGTIENQLQFLCRYCQLHEYIIAGEYLDNGVTGTLPLGERPEGGRLLKDASAKDFGLILVYRLDRLSRKTLHLLEVVELLDSLSIGLKSATEEFNTQTPTGRLVLTILASIATLERETIAERTWLGRIRVAGQGKVPGGLPPLGYRFKDSAVVINEEEAALVQRVFGMYVYDRLGTEAIANRLNAEGVLPAKWRWGKGEKGYKGRPSRGTWCAARIADIIKNLVYSGKYSYGNLTIDCPAIVDRELWEAAQRQRAQNQLLAGRNTKHRTYLLKGLIRCGACGRRYVGNGSPTKSFGYTCPNRKPPVKCPGPRLPAVPLEEAIWRDVSAFARNPGPVLEELTRRLQEDAAQEQPLDSELEAVHKALRALDSERQRLLTLYRKGRMTEEDLESQLDASDREKASLVAHREELTGRLMALRGKQTQLITAEGVLKALQERVENADESTRAELIRGLVPEVVVHPGPRIEVTYCFAPPGHIDAVNWGR